MGALLNTATFFYYYLALEKNEKKKIPLYVWSCRNAVSKKLLKALGFFCFPGFPYQFTGTFLSKSIPLMQLPQKC